MSYIINKTTGEVLITILDGTADGPLINPGQNVSDVNLFGKNYPLFGDKLDENFITLLQNSAAKAAPTTPLQGELWYDLSTGFLKIYTGTIWTPVSPVIVANTAPSTTLVGAQWWDTVNYQLNSWNGGSWTLIGPAYKQPDGKSGAIVQDVLDTVGGTHTIIAFYNNNNVVAVSSYDPSFTLSPVNPIAGFNTINPGFTLATGVANNLFYGTTTNSQFLGNVVATNYARTDIIPTFSSNVLIAGGNISIDSAPNGTARYYNTVMNGNLSLYVNKGGSLVNAIKVMGVDGNTTISGALTVGNSLTAYGVTSTGATGTGNLVFSASPTLTGTLSAQTASFNGDVSTTGNLSINGNIFSVNGVTGDTVIAGNLISQALTLSNSLTAYGVTTTGATGTGQLVFSTSPTLTGTLSAQAASFNGNVSTTGNLSINGNKFLVNGVTGDTVIAGNLSLGSGSTVTVYGVTSTGATGTGGLVFSYSPGLSGTPTAPTASTTTSTTQIASTEFVKNAIPAATNALWLGSSKTVSTNLPDNTQGTNGDFWFQI